MIEIETEMFSAIASKLRANFPGIFVAGEYTQAPATFPCVTIEQMDNYTYERSQTNALSENHANVTFEVNVYSNKLGSKKSECKTISAFIDAEMQSLGFTRILLNPIPNLNDATIYRIVGRYRAVVSTDKTIYRR